MMFSQNLTIAIVKYAESLFLFILMQLQNTYQNQKGVFYYLLILKSVCCGIYLDSCLHYEMDEL